jgi:general secretion pathway protein H
MTLIELVVVLAIVGIMFVVGAVGIGAIRGADVDATASVVAGAMTYVASMAVHDNKTYRLVIDMDQKRYWAESVNTDDPCARLMPDDADAGLNPEGEAESVRGKGRADEANGEDLAPDPGFSAATGDLLKGDFEPGTNVTAILTGHHDQIQTEGRAAVYFYPNGYAERALLWVGAPSSDAPTGWVAEVTVELHSLGRVTRHGGVLDERDFDLAQPEEVQ